MTVLTIPIDTLAEISKHPTTIHMLCARFGKSNATIKSRVTALHRMELITRHKYGNKYVYRLSEKGKTILEVFK